MPIIDELERLADLYDAGVLSEAEYRAGKAAIVAEGEGPPSLTRAAERRLAVATIVVAVVIGLIGIAAAVLDDGDDSDTVSASDTTDPTSDPNVLRSTVSVTINLPGATAPAEFLSTSSSTASSSPSTTAGGVTTATTAVATAGGEGAVTALWAAYKAGDQGAARKVAVSQVVDSLFQVAWSAPDATTEPCAPVEARVRCVYVHKGERITFTAEKAASGAWMVVAVSYQKPATTTTTAGGTTTSSGSTSSSSSSSTSSTGATIPFP